MPEQPDRQKHRNRKFSIPFMGEGGRQNCFSRNDFLTGQSQVRFGDQQSMNVTSEDEVPGPDGNPETYPKNWPKAGRILGVPKVVVMTSLPCWPEFWENCSFDCPRTVIGTLLKDPSSGPYGNYRYLQQYDSAAIDWKGHSTGSVNDAEYRFCQEIGTGTGTYPRQHSKLIDTVFPAAAKILAGLPEPIYAIIPRYMPSRYDSIVNKNIAYVPWTRFSRWWSGSDGDDVDFSVGLGNDDCDIYGAPFSPRGRVHMDPQGPNNVSDCNPPKMPCLLAGDPTYFGTNVLHMYIGHWAMKWGIDPNILTFESYPLSPIAEQIATQLIGDNYHGSPIPGYDGSRLIWFDYGYNYGYMSSDGKGNNSSTGGVAGLLNYYKGSLTSAANNYKTAFWKYRDFATRLFQYPEPIKMIWNPDILFKDQKWCAAEGFWFGFDTFDDWVNLHPPTEDGHFSNMVDAPDNPLHLKTCINVTRTPDSPNIREGVNYAFPYLKDRVEAYYRGIDPGTSMFMDGMIAQNQLDEYNVVNEGSGADMMSADGIVDYVRTYFAAQEEQT